MRGRERAEAALDRALRRNEELAAKVDRAEARAAKAETDLKFAQSRIRELLEQSKPPTSTVTPEPLSRQQRRAMERSERKRRG
jgi:hypothetical protein